MPGEQAPEVPLAAAPVDDRPAAAGSAGGEGLDLRPLAAGNSVRPEGAMVRQGRCRTCRDVRQTRQGREVADMPRDKACRRFAIVGKTRLLRIVEGEQFGSKRRPLHAPVGADFAKRLGAPQGSEGRKPAVQCLLALRQSHLTAARRSRRR